MPDSDKQAVDIHFLRVFTFYILDPDARDTCVITQHLVQHMIPGDADISFFPGPGNELVTQDFF